MGMKLASATLAIGGLVLGSLLGSLAAGTAAASGGFTVNTTADTPAAYHGDNRCADASGHCSLRAAIQASNATQGKTTITLQPDATYDLAIRGAGEDRAASGDLDVTGHVRIIGNGATLNANGIDRAFDVMPGAWLEIENLTIVGGAPPAGESGGAVRSAGTLKVSLSHLSGNTVSGEGASGGAILNDEGVLTVERSTIAHNAATRAGGGIEAVGGKTTVHGSYLLNNHTGPTPGNGGGLHITGAGTVEVTYSYVRNNFASAEGGGLWNSAEGTMTISNVTITGNIARGEGADQGGGGLFNDGGALYVANSTINGNVADGTAGSGGGILNDRGKLTVEGSSIAFNTAKRAGGGVEANEGTTVLRATSLIENHTGPAPGNGGGLHITGRGTVEVDRGIVRGNTASAEGGGLWNSAAGTMTVTHTFVGNNIASGAEADQGGGGLFNDGGTLTVRNSTVFNNVADGAAGSGGGIFNDRGVLQVQSTHITGNTAKRAGGGIEANSGQTHLTAVSLLNNHTGPNPGNGGGFHITGAGSVRIHGSNVSGNSASNEGGGLWNSAHGTIIVSLTIIEGNQSSNGPDVFNVGGTFIIDEVAVPRS